MCQALLTSRFAFLFEDDRGRCRFRRRLCLQPLLLSFFAFEADIMEGDPRVCCTAFYRIAAVFGFFGDEHAFVVVVVFSVCLPPQVRSRIVSPWTKIRFVLRMSAAELPTAILYAPLSTANVSLVTSQKARSACFSLNVTVFVSFGASSTR